MAWLTRQSSFRKLLVFIALSWVALALLVALATQLHRALA
jgi:hypothetical protein